MRLAKGKRITKEDRAEIAKFGEFLRDVDAGKDQRTAYAEHYGEVVFEAEDKAP